MRAWLEVKGKTAAGGVGTAREGSRDLARKWGGLSYHTLN